MIPTLPASIPYLKPHGANWAIFAKRFQYAMKATRRWPYFTGGQPCPKPKDAGKPTASEIDAAEEWEYEAWWPATCCPYAFPTPLLCA